MKPSRRNRSRPPRGVDGFRALQLLVMPLCQRSQRTPRQAGDIITIDKSSGKISLLGRSFARRAKVELAGTSKIYYDLGIFRVSLLPLAVLMTLATSPISPSPRGSLKSAFWIFLALLWPGPEIMMLWVLGHASFNALRVSYRNARRPLWLVASRGQSSQLLTSTLW